VSADLLVAKLKQIIEREAQRTGAGARGVSGSLLEMSLPDMVQVLWHGERALAQDPLRHHFRRNPLRRWRHLQRALGHPAREEAFYAMLKLADGDFSLIRTSWLLSRWLWIHPKRCFSKACGAWTRGEDEVGVVLFSWGLVCLRAPPGAPWHGFCSPLCLALGVWRLSAS